MKCILHQLHKALVLLCFLGISFCGFSQSQYLDKERCEVLLKKAGLKYQVVFNYDYQELKDLNCLEELPPTFSEFRALMADYSGLTFEAFSSTIWVIKKNYTHQIRFIDTDNNPIHGVNLKSFNKTSNRFGYLFLEVKQYPEILDFTYLDYDNFSLKIDENSPKVMNLNMVQVSLAEVILNNLYIKGVFLDTDKHITVKPKYTPLLAGQVQQDAFVTLLNLPQISTTTESIAELNIKGGVNDQNLLLWNGIKLFQNAHFFGLLSAFNDNLITTITVIDNATPAQYGNALSGTIKLDFDTTFSTKNSYGFGLNSLSGHAFLRQKIAKDTELSFAMQRSFTDIVRTPTFESYRQKVYQDSEIELSENAELSEEIKREDVFYFQDAQFQFKKKFGRKLNLSVQGIWFENNLDYTEKINGFTDKKSTFTNTNAAFGLHSRYDWNNDNTLTFLYNYSQHKSDGNNNTFTGNLDTFQFNSVDNYFLQLLWTHRKSKYKWNAGIDFEGNSITNQFNNNVTAAFLNLVQIGNNYAAFGDYSFQSNQWKLFAGIRNVYYQRDQQFSFEPRFSISYTLNESLEISLRGEKKSQNLKQIIDLDQNFLGIEKRRWFMSGQDQLALQKTHQIETMLKFDKQKFGGFASLFVRQLEGLSSNDQRFQNENQFTSFQNGSSKILGTSVHLFYKDTRLNSWLSYAYLNEKINTPNQAFAGNNNLNYHLTWGNNFRYNQWNFSFSCVFHEGLSFTSINEMTPLITDATTGLNTINFNTPNNEKLPDYFRMDTSIQYELKRKDAAYFKFSLGIINLGDNQNVLRRNYRLNRIDSDQIQKIETLGLGFTPNFGVLCVF
jgi:hypothetical protein